VFRQSVRKFVQHLEQSKQHAEQNYYHYDVQHYPDNCPNHVCCSIAFEIRCIQQSSRSRFELPKFLNIIGCSHRRKSQIRLSSFRTLGTVHRTLLPKHVCRTSGSGYLSLEARHGCLSHYFPFCCAASNKSSHSPLLTPLLCIGLDYFKCLFRGVLSW